MGPPANDVRAASAQRLLAAQQDENIQTLSEALRPADGRDESKIAAAARAETQGREKAIAILTALLGKVPAQAVTKVRRHEVLLALGGKLHGCAEPPFSATPTSCPSAVKAIAQTDVV